jgi:hypothetical protein
MIDWLTRHIWETARGINKVRITGSALKGNFKPLQLYAAHRVIYRAVGDLTRKLFK